MNELKSKRVIMGGESYQEYVDAINLTISFLVQVKADAVRLGIEKDLAYDVDPLMMEVKMLANELDGVYSEFLRMMDGADNVLDIDNITIKYFDLMFEKSEWVGQVFRIATNKASNIYGYIYESKKEEIE